MNTTRSSHFLFSWKRIKLTYGHFVSRLNVEHEILNYVHFVLGVDDMKTWDTDVNNEDRNLNLKHYHNHFVWMQITHTIVDSEFQRFSDKTSQLKMSLWSVGNYFSRFWQAK